jgi:hypothetical protein
VGLFQVPCSQHHGTNICAWLLSGSLCASKSCGKHAGGGPAGR